MNERSNKKRRKFDDRARKIRILLFEYNAENQLKGTKGWYWRCGALGAWLELVKDGILPNNSGNSFMPFIMEGVKMDEIAEKAPVIKTIEDAQVLTPKSDGSVAPIPKLPKTSNSNLKRINGPLNYYKKRNNSDFYNPNNERQVLGYNKHNSCMNSINDHNDDSWNRILNGSNEMPDNEDSILQNDIKNKTNKNYALPSDQKLKNNLLKVEIIEAEIEPSDSYDF